MPQGRLLVLYNPSQSLWKSRVEQRLRESLGPERSARVTFTPNLPKGDFYRLLASVHVVLDTYPFGGGVTILEGNCPMARFSSTEALVD